MRKGNEVRCKNGRVFRFNKPDEMKLFVGMTQGTPWEEETTRIYKFKRIHEMKPRERSAVDDLIDL